MRIAVTGGIAQGKSVVCARLKELGFTVGSADEIAREVFSRPEINVQIADAIGVSAPATPGQVRSAIMISPELRRAINTLMHPAIVDAVGERSFDVVEMPLLIEACLQRQFDYVCVVTCSEKCQRERLVERYGPEADVEAILSSQLPTDVKIPFADKIIRTDGSLESVINFVDSWAKELFALSE